ncbi:hypothetical protein ABIC83_002994 [Roseateles asaccharophilus]|uniref:hypothetical protein n=1 Tax=Roseateles asaccharophilus TaxID=582607 RepID=UPI00383971D8
MIAMSSCAPIVHEIFGLPGDWQLRNLGSTSPRVLNGEVSVKRFRVTVEEIIEPPEVLAGRIRELQKGALHVDSRAALMQYAKQNNLEL